VASNRGKPPPPKRHHSERWRFSQAKVERWTNAKAAWIAFQIGQQKSSREIEREIRDGTSAATIRRMIHLWKLPVTGMRRGIVVQLAQGRRARLEKLAAKRGITPEQYLDRICSHAIRDDLYDAIVDEGGK